MSQVFPAFPVVQSPVDLDTGTHGFITPTRELMVSNRIRLLGDAFDGTGALAGNLWGVTIAGSATATLSGGSTTLATGTTANSSVVAKTNIVAREMAGFYNAYTGVVRAGDNGVANNSRKWGVANATEGYYWELDGTTLYVVWLSGGVAHRTAASSWSAGAYTADLTKPAGYAILHTADDAWFFINGNLVHVLPATQGPYVATTNLALLLSNTNSGGATSDVALVAQASAISRLGPAQSNGRFRNLGPIAGTVIKDGPGSLHRITVNITAGAGGVLTVYDNTAASGAIIAAIDLSKVTPSTLEYGFDFNVGLFVDITGSGSGNVTVVFD